jgi:hypothetical protein
MRSRIPRFVLEGSQGWKTFDARQDAVVLAAFSSYDAAAAFCEADTEQPWRLHSLSPNCPPGIPEPRGTVPILLALDAPGPNARSLPAVPLSAVLAALREGHETVEAEYRLVRDCAKDPWTTETSHSRDGRAGDGRWYVSCKHPGDLTLSCGDPMWFWLEWFAGRHVSTDHQPEAGVNAEEDLFAFHSQKEADDFRCATVARLDGAVRHCYLDSHHGADFEVAIWEEGGPAPTRTLGKIGENLPREVLASQSEDSGLECTL